MKRIWRKILSIFYHKPKSKLTWDKEDFIKGRNWAKTQVSPINKNESLWDYVKHHDTIQTINEINKYLNY